MTAEERLARIEAAHGDASEIGHLVEEVNTPRTGLGLREWIRIRNRARAALVSMAPMDLLAALERLEGYGKGFVALAINDKDADEVLAAFQPLLATDPERVASLVRDLATDFSGRIETQRTQKLKHPQPLVPEALEVLCREPALEGVTGFNLDWARKWVRSYRPRDGSEAPAPPPRPQRPPSGIGATGEAVPAGEADPWARWQAVHAALLVDRQPDPDQSLWSWDGHGVEIQNGELVWFSEAGHAAVQSYDDFLAKGRLFPPVPDEVLADLFVRLAPPG